MFYNKDQIASYMIQGHVHLSKKDFGFFNNINKQIQEHKPVTSNQNKLFDKLLLKYKRQLQKLGQNADELKQLNWNIEVIPSEAEYLSAKISIENNKIIIRCPYKTKFIQKFKNVPNNCFAWQKHHKCYTANVSTHNLKIAYYELNKYFDDILYDANVQLILDELNEYKNCNIWQPTLIKVGQYFYIYGINESIYEATSNLELCDDPNILLQLSHYGVKIHESIVKDDAFKQFASDFYTVIDVDNVETLSDWIDILKFDCIYLGSDIIFNKEISKGIKDALGNIPMTRNAADLDLYTNVLYVNYNSYKTTNSPFLLVDNDELNRNISKVLTIKNSRPVYVK